MDDRGTIRVTALMLGGLFVICFVLTALAMP